MELLNQKSEEKVPKEEVAQCITHGTRSIRYISIFHLRGAEKGDETKESVQDESRDNENQVDKSGAQI